MAGHQEDQDRRKVARWLSASVAGIFFVAVIIGGGPGGLVQINVQKWAEQRGYDLFLVRWWDAAVSGISAIMASPWFWWLFGFFSGTTAVLWLLRRFPDLDAALLV